MIKYETLTVAKLREMYNVTKTLKSPRFQRVTKPAKKLYQSLITQAKQHGGLPCPIILWLDKGVYWILDWRTRLLVVLQLKFPAVCRVPATVYSDICYAEARSLYIELNRTGVKQSTGELIHAYETEFPQSLKDFTKDPAWAMYEKRFKFLEPAVKLYFETIGKPAYSCDAILERLTPEEQLDDSKTDTGLLDNVLKTITTCQSVLSTVESMGAKLNGTAVKKSTWWPIMWMYRAFQNEPTLRKRTNKQLAEGFASWAKTRVGKIDTSQPNRPKSELDKNMKDLVTSLRG
jgi:hypothetical protein